MKNELAIDRCYSVGVIIPVFNSGEMAIHAIRSIINQKDFVINQVVIVDDGSSDGSADFLRRATEQIATPIKIFSIANRGAAGARNYGMGQCDCDVYAFLDSDDLWFPDKLSRQLPLFMDPAVGMVGCLTNMDGATAMGHNEIGSVEVISLRQQLFKNYFQTSSVLVRRDVVNVVGGFPEGQRYAEEGDFFNRIVAKYKAVLINDVLVNYSNGKAGFGHSGLSSNLIEMERGELRNIFRAFARNDCSFTLYVTCTAYSFVKFLRRLLLTFVKITVPRKLGN